MCKLFHHFYWLAVNIKGLACVFNTYGKPTKYLLHLQNCPLYLLQLQVSKTDDDQKKWLLSSLE